MYRNEVDYIEKKAREQAQHAVIGEVTKVFEHTKESDFSNHEANVRIQHSEEEFRKIPIVASYSQQARVPQTGDFVIVDFIDGQSQNPVITGFLHTRSDRAPIARSGHWRHQFGSDGKLFVEAEPSDHSAGDADIVRIAKKLDGLSDPSTAIELDDSGSNSIARLWNGNLSAEVDDTTASLSLESGGTTVATVEIDDAGNITIEADSDLVLSAPNGNVTVDEGGVPEKVAKQNHDHDVTLSDGSTATTSNPNQSGTQVEIE